MKKADLFWQTYLNLEREFLDLAKYIFITDVKTATDKNGLEKTENYNGQLETFSPYIADLLIQCCVQIEAVSKEIYYDIGGSKKRGDTSIHFDEDCLKEIDKKWDAGDKVVMVVAPTFNLVKDENKVLQPLKNAHKRGGTDWERAYQAVKHDRYRSLTCGNVKMLMRSLAALYLLNLYHRQDTMITKYQELDKLDMSMGSALFCVKPPMGGNPWNDNVPEKSNSPYVVKYKEESFKRIQQMRQEETQRLQEYWDAQPERKDPNFINQLNEQLKRNPEERLMHIWELAKFRLHKIASMDLPFEKRKKELLSSEGWNCWVNQNNPHAEPDDITPENIEKVIDETGVHWGMEIMRQFQQLKWLGFALNEGLCEVSIE